MASAATSDPQALAHHASRQLRPLLTALFVQTPGLSALLHLQPLHADDWLQAGAAAAAAGAAALLLGGRGR